MSQTPKTVGIDIGKNSFHVVGHDERAAIVWSRGQLEPRFANTPPCLVDREACVGGRHLSRTRKAPRHDAWLIPAKYVRPHFEGAEERIPRYGGDR